MGGAINHTPQPEFPDYYERGMGVDMIKQFGSDTVSAVGNAHPAAQASLAVAGTIATAPFAYVAYEYASLQAMLHPEAVIYTGEVVIPIVDGAYGGTPPNNIPSSIGKGLDEIGLMP